MPRAAAAATAAARLLQMRAWAAGQRAWGAQALAPLSAAATAAPMLGGGGRGPRDALVCATPPRAAAAAATAAATHAAAGAPSSPLLPSFASASFSSVSEAAVRARRLAAAQARRQQQHDRAAARLARAPSAAAAAADALDDDGPVADDGALALPEHPAGSLDRVDPGSLRPSDAAAVARAVSHPALVVTRAVEWGTVVFGFEQANKYTVYDQDGRVACLIAEDETGLTNALGRQLLRTRRAFTATVLSPADGSVLFRVRRPAYLVSSTTFVEAEDGTAIGEVRQRWHPLRRNFDLYIGQKQYARISGPLLAWEFVLTDDAGDTLALIDRNFQGFARELFTDAGKYVVHFGHGAEDSARMAQRTLEARAEGAGRRADWPPVRPLALLGAASGGGASGGGAGDGAGQQPQQGASGADAAAAVSASSSAVAAIPQTTGGQLAVSRPLALDERLVALAAAIAIDFAFFSQHSHTSGMFAPPLIFPMPFPGGGGAAEEAGGEGAAAAGAGGGDAGGGAAAGGAGGGAPDAGLGGGGGGFGGAEAPQQPDESGWGWAGGDGGGGGDGGDSGWTDGWGGGGGDDAGGDGEGGGTVGSVVRGLWRVFGDDD